MAHRRTRLDTQTVVHPKTGESLEVRAFDDGNFDVIMLSPRKWVTGTNFSAKDVSKATRIELIALSEHMQ
jgi:hypothetical protein